MVVVAEKAVTKPTNYIMKMAKCANCGAAMSCTCQTRRSAGGKVGCTNCIGALNAAERATKTNAGTNTPNPNPPTINKVTVKTHK